MILTLGWKEFREHRAIWLTMIMLTVGLGIGMGHIVGANDPRASVAMASLAILGLAAVYGMVCGAMMLAGEHEAGTMSFLDVFAGQRWLLWIVKFFLGTIFVVTQALAVAAALYYLDQTPPTWGPGIVGRGRHGAGGFDFAGHPPGPNLWFAVLPMIMLEAYAWGLFGSAFSQRVLAGAAIAAVGAAPVWLFSVFAPPPVFLGVRVAAAVIVLIISYFQFVTSLGHTPLGLVPLPEEGPNRRREFLDRWERLARDDWERADEYDSEYDSEAVPTSAPALLEAAEEEKQQARSVGRGMRRRRNQQDAASPTHALFWLTFQQAWAFFLILASVCLVLGLFLPPRGQVLWPVATLLLGIACGTATFGSEQRDFSYQFLSAQHLPLNSIWRFKVLFWFGAAILAVLIFVLAGFLSLSIQVMNRPRHPAFPVAAPTAFQFGTLHSQLGAVLFFGVWLVYGFVAGHLFVWLCRKTMLALALSTLVAAGVLGLWLPSLLCGGMGGWQLWIVPTLMMLAAFKLVRPWAGGRIKDRSPMALLIGFAALNLGWIAVNLAYRAWELPDVGPPMDRTAFRALIPTGRDNAGGQKVQEALAQVDAARDNAWLDRLSDAARLPLGVIEAPTDDGQAPLLRHLPVSVTLITSLRVRAQQAQGNPDVVFNHLNQILFLSRTLRNKASVEGYLAGIRAEDSAFDGLDFWLSEAKPDPEMLRTALKELERHAAETPPPLDCLRTECYRSGGMLLNPGTWSFAVGPARIPESWLINGINLSLDLPWEEERGTRLWQIVWAGLFRTMTAPNWDLPQMDEDPPTRKESTKQILRSWLPGGEGADASLTTVRLASLLDVSWLSDEKLFPSARLLHDEGTRSRWRVDACRLKMALTLYQLQEGKTAPALDALAPKYLPDLPVDPFTGRPPGYRISKGEVIPGIGPVQPGQAILWSTGPDRRNDGGLRHGGNGHLDHQPWRLGGLDLISIVPAWK